jgi:hypothetical protein
VQKILSDDQPVNNTKLRVDTLPCPLLPTCGDIAVPLQEGLPVGIEVQTLLYDERGFPKFATVGFFAISKATTGNMVARSSGQEPPTKLMIRSTEWGKSYVIEGRDVLYYLIDQLADEGNWRNERPIIVLQSERKKLGANKKV